MSGRDVDAEGLDAEERERLVGEALEAELAADDAAGDRDGTEADGVRTVEDLLDQLEAVIAERDQYLALAREKQAEFENYRKQTMRRQAEHLQQATAGLVERLLVVLDALDQGVAHGQEALEPVRAQLVGLLEKEGLERVDPAGEPFDPARHDAVLHEPAEGGEGPVVAEVMRPGYVFHGRVLRAAMVKVNG